MNLSENGWRKRLKTDRFVEWASETLLKEENSLIFGSLLGYAAAALRMDGYTTPLLEETLQQIAKNPRRSHD